MINLNKSSSISRRHKFSFAIDDDLLISSDLIEMWGEGSHSRKARGEFLLYYLSEKSSLV